MTTEASRGGGALHGIDARADHNRAPKAPARPPAVRVYRPKEVFQRRVLRQVYHV